jgi:3-dehydroquinate synthase
MMMNGKEKPMSVSDTLNWQGVPVVIGCEIFDDISSRFLLGRYSKIAVLADTNTDYWTPVLHRGLGREIVPIVIPSGESSKNLSQVEEIWKEMLESGLDRHSLLVNLGGGVVCDLGGFAASTYMRGIDFLNVPTTLLAQVDAGIGGKTGIDLFGIKNLVGTFSRPIGVITDVQTLSTLPRREFLSGFAEIIKHGLIQSRAYFERVTSKPAAQFTRDELVGMIGESCRIKAEIVKADEKELNLRKILNFGHTIGHAVESLSLETVTPLLHGEAISIGMLTEATISCILGLLTAADLQQIRQALLRAELPVAIKDATVAGILEKTRSDKKNEKGKVNFTLLDGIGVALCNQSVPDDVIIAAIDQNL